MTDQASPSELLKLYLGQIDHRLGEVEQRARDIDKRMDKKFDELEAQVGALGNIVTTYGEQIKTLFKNISVRGAGVGAISGGTLIAIVEVLKHFLG